MLPLVEAKMYVNQSSKYIQLVVMRLKSRDSSDLGDIHSEVIAQEEIKVMPVNVSNI